MKEVVKKLSTQQLLRWLCEDIMLELGAEAEGQDLATY